MEFKMVAEYSKRITARIQYSLALITVVFFIISHLFLIFNSVEALSPWKIFDYVFIFPFFVFLALGTKKKVTLLERIIFLSLLLTIPMGMYLFLKGRILYFYYLLFPLSVIVYSLEKRKAYFTAYLVLIFTSFFLYLIFPQAFGVRIGNVLFHFLAAVLVVALCLILDKDLLLIEKKLQFIRFSDHKTNLPNRDKFINDINSNPQKNIVAIINVDSFKEINDLYGFACGDDVLISVSKQLCRIFPDYALYRLSGSEFGLIYSFDGESESQVNYIKQEFMKSKEFELTAGEHSFRISLTMGIAVEGAEDTERTNVLANADMALQAAKTSRSKIMLHSRESSLKKIFSDKSQWHRKLVDSFSENRFFVFFQPIHNNGTGLVDKYECLARFIDEEGNLYSPQAFLGHLKSTGLYSRFTRTIVKKSFSALSELDGDLSINLGVEDLQDPFTVQYIMLMLENNKADANRIQFEILETARLENLGELNSIFLKLASYGCKIAIDDFGSGYSNFEYLSKVRVDCIKIDGSLIQNINQDRSTYNMVRNIVNFCNDLDVEIIAEYVSDEEIYVKVKEMGIHYSQGYFFGKPYHLSHWTAGSIGLRGESKRTGA